MEKCKTMGGDTYFEFTYSDEKLIINYGFTSNQQTTVEIPAQLIKTVIKRVEYMKLNDIEHLRTVGYYSLTHWKDCPNTHYCPYIAKLVLDVFPDVVIEELGILN